MSWKKWLDKGLDVAKLVAGNTPVGAIITLIDAVVESTNGFISDNSVKNTLLAMSKSKFNKLTPEKLEKINDILDN